ncbi:hypothetical protein ACHAPT_006485 [Fusarium lateritium]
MSASRDFAVDRGILAQVSCNNAHGDTLLHWAIRNHATSLARRLLQDGVLTNLPNDEGQTPLHLAVSSKDLATCKLLVASGANIHTKDKQNDSPVDLAMAALLDCQLTDDSILGFLVQKGTGSTEHQTQLFRAFCFTISNCQSILTDVFLRKGWNLLDRDSKTGATALHFAINPLESLAPLERLVTAGVDINAVDSEGVAVLHIAAQRGNPRSLNYLVEHGATVDAIDYGLGGTPLTGTIFGAKVDNARVLIEAGASVFHKVKAGRPLLHLAAQQGQREILKLIVSGGVPVNTLDEIGETAAYWACQNSHLECIEFLLSQGLDLKDGKTDLMKEAISKGSIPIVECLRRHGDLPITEQCLHFLHGTEDIDPSRWEMLYFILQHLPSRQASEGGAEDESSDLIFSLEPYLSFGLLNVAAALVEAGRGVGHLNDMSRARLLLVCAQHGFLSGARALLGGASPLDKVQKFYIEPHGWRALEVAVCENDVELIKLFLEHGWDPNREDVRGRKSLHLAALCGASDAVKELLPECSVHHRDKERNTPVHLGAYSGSVQVLDLLFTPTGDLDRQNKAGGTSLGIACDQGHADAVRWLLDHGFRDQTGDALHLSARHNHVDCIAILIASGSNVNAKRAGGNTPLHVAAKSGAWKAVSRLLQAGADPNCTNHQGMTPLAMALFHANQCPDTFTELFQKSSVDWDTPLSRNVIFTSCIGGNQSAIAAVFARLKQERPKTAKKIVRRVLPELIAELCSEELCAEEPAARSVAFPILLEYMHTSSKKVLSTKILIKTIQAGDGAELAQALVDIDPKNAYICTKSLWSMLHLACRYGRIKIARVLLANGAPALAENEGGLSPLEVAKNHLVGERLDEFVNLFRGYETALNVLRREDQDQDLMLAAEMRMLGVEDEEYGSEEEYDSDEESDLAGE